MVNRSSRARTRRRLLTAGGAAALVAASLTTGATGASARVAPPNIEPELLAELDDAGSTSFWVYLAERAELSPAPLNSGAPVRSRADATR